MSDSEPDATQTSREEDAVSFEIYFWIVRSINEKGVVKISDLRKIYQTVVIKDKSVQIRPLQEILKLVNENLRHWQGWSAVMQEDRITYVNLDSKKQFSNIIPSETERTRGLLENILMYVFMATKPNSKHPGVTQEELMTYLETALSTYDGQKLTEHQTEMFKKQLAPNPRADFIKKGYLSFSKAIENDDEVFRYEWGAAARQTIDPVHLVQVFQKMTGMAPAQLKEQMERAQALKADQLEAIKRGVVLPTRGK